MNNLTVKQLAGLVAALGTIIGAAFLIDERYAHAQAVRAAQVAVESKVEESSLELRQWIIEDRILQIESKPAEKRTDVERALLDRYKRESEQTSVKLRSIRRQ